MGIKLEPAIIRSRGLWFRIDDLLRHVSRRELKLGMLESFRVEDLLGFVVDDKKQRFEVAVVVDQKPAGWQTQVVWRRRGSRKVCSI